MKTTDRSRSRKSLFSFGVIAALAVGAATAQVATGTTGIDATGSYQSEVQACMTGKTQQDQSTCLLEARNANADKQRGLIGAQGTLASNAMARCEVFQSAEEKAACQARVMGMGNADGSVAGGGVIREVETVVMPKGASSVTVVPQTSDPVVLIPSK